MTCEPEYGTGKIMTMVQRYLHGDGRPAAELKLITGMFDIATRRLAEDPYGVLRSLAGRPELLRAAATTHGSHGRPATHRAAHLGSRRARRARLA